MKRYEYQTVYYLWAAENFVTFANIYGQSGWAVVAINYRGNDQIVFLYLMREINEKGEPV